MSVGNRDSGGSVNIIVRWLVGTAKENPELWPIVGALAFLTFASYALDAPAIIDGLCGVYLPALCLLIPVFTLTAILWMWLRLQRRQPSKITGAKELIIRNSKRRRLMKTCIVLTLLIGVAGTRYCWIAYYYLPSSTADLRILIDSFEKYGFEGTNVEQRIKVAMERELATVTPSLKIEFLPSPPEGVDELDERFIWARNNGAAIVIYGKMDDGKFWPSIRVCSQTVPPLDFPEHETEVQISGKEIPSATKLPDALTESPRDRRLCSLEGLATSRVSYMALAGLGRVLMYHDVPSLTQRQQIESAHRMFSRAVGLEKDHLDCGLNYCDALYHVGVTANVLSRYEQDPTSVMSLLDTAADAFRKAVSLDPEFTEAWIDLGKTLRDYTTWTSGDKADEYFRESVSMFEIASIVESDPKIDTNLQRLYFNWGNVESDYADFLGGVRSDSHYVRSFAHYAKAESIGPSSGAVLNNWGIALRNSGAKRPDFIGVMRIEEAVRKFDDAYEAWGASPIARFNKGNALLILTTREHGSTKDSCYQACFKAFECASEGSYRKDMVYYSWAFALSQYASWKGLPIGRSKFEESFSKFAEAIRLNPEMHDAQYNWANALAALAELSGGDSLRYFYRKAFLHFAESIRLRPDFLSALYDCGASLANYHISLTGRADIGAIRETLKFLDDARNPVQAPECRARLLALLNLVAEEDPEIRKHISSLRNALL